MQEFVKERLQNISFIYLSHTLEGCPSWTARQICPELGIKASYMTQLVSVNIVEQFQLVISGFFSGVLFHLSHMISQNLTAFER